MSQSINQKFKLQTSFQIIYSHEYKLYDFTVLDLKTKKVIYHYHFPNLKTINKLIQQYK
jgi:hypothetical protein